MGGIGPFALALVLFGGVAALVLRWTHRDLHDSGPPTARAAAATWVMYVVLHADTVAAAAWAQVLTLPLPDEPALGIGVLLAVIGLSGFLAATAKLAGHAEQHQLRSRALVAVGPYRFSRHPQTVGWTVMLLRFAITGRSALALLVVGVFVVVAQRLGALEELHLRGVFGEGYEHYRARTPAIIGRPAPAGRPPTAHHAASQRGNRGVP